MQRYYRVGFNFLLPIVFVCVNVCVYFLQLFVLLFRIISIISLPSGFQQHVDFSFKTPCQCLQSPRVPGQTQASLPLCLLLIQPSFKFLCRFQGPMETSFSVLQMIDPQIKFTSDISPDPCYITLQRVKILLYFFKRNFISFFQRQSFMLLLLLYLAQYFYILARRSPH